MLKIFNTLSNSEEAFSPIDSQHIKIYVCGPTVYDRPHLGNARSVVFYDFLNRILRAIYPKVTYVRNITDVDDKIIARAKEENISPLELTAKVEKLFRDDMSALNCTDPDYEPHATDYIPQMLGMIKCLIESGHAYQQNSTSDVMFSVKSYQEYGRLSNRTLESMIPGSRIAVSDAKECEFDFVLWKYVTDKNELGWESEFGYGRPGWHIECSAMSANILGSDFDIHGGGVDLQFPHHENEIAQSRCAFKGSNFAKYWIHNGFLMVDGQKMSKSLGNFTTVKDLLDKGIDGNVIRFALLNTHYRKPLDFNDHLIASSKIVVQKFLKLIDDNADLIDKNCPISLLDGEMSIPVLARDAIFDNVNISKYTAVMHSLLKDIKYTKDIAGRKMLCQQFWNMMKLLGLC